MNNPLVSVAVPVYNVASYLEQCLDSVVNQTYKNLEIILVDDDLQMIVVLFATVMRKKIAEFKSSIKKMGGYHRLVM